MARLPHYRHPQHSAPQARACLNNKLRGVVYANKYVPVHAPRIKSDHALSSSSTVAAGGASKRNLRQLRSDIIWPKFVQVYSRCLRWCWVQRQRCCNWYRGLLWPSLTNPVPRHAGDPMAKWIVCHFWARDLRRALTKRYSRLFNYRVGRRGLFCCFST